MLELPDITAYLEALRPRILGERCLGVRVVDLRRLGKWIVIGLEGGSRT
jgi:hypothetical protein